MVNIRKINLKTLLYKVFGGLKNNILITILKNDILEALTSEEEENKWRLLVTDRTGAREK